jgi:hypothetical protein
MIHLKKVDANYGGSKRHNFPTCRKYSNIQISKVKKLLQNDANYGGSKRHNLPTTACLKIFKFQTLQITAVQNAIIYLQLHVLKNIQI